MSDNALGAAKDERFTFCRICEAHCGLIATVEEGRITALRPDREALRSKGFSCVKGTNFHRVVHDPDRVTVPLRRSGGPGEFEPVSWDEALDDIAARLKAILAEHGPDAVASYKGNPIAFATEASAGLLRFLDHFGIWKYYGAGSQDTNARMAANYFLFGAAGTLEIPDLAQCDQLFMFGANPLVSNGSILGSVRCRDDLDAIAARGRIVVIDPRRSETAARYDHVSIQPNSDAWLLVAMLQHAFAQADRDWLDAHSIGWAELERAIAAIPLARCAAETGMDEAELTALAASFVAVPRSAAYGRLGLCRGPYATLENFLLTALNVVAGKFDHAGGTTFAVPMLAGSDRPGASGYAEHQSSVGGFPTVLRFLASAIMPEDLAGEGSGQKVRAVMATGGNVLLAAPGGSALEHELQQLELFFSIDFYMNESNRYADYILPAVTFMERSDLPMTPFGTMLTPIFQYTDPVIDPCGEARDEFTILTDLAERMGRPLPGNRPLDDIGRALSTGPCGDMFAGRPPLEVLREHPHGIAYPGKVTNDPWKKIALPDRKVALWPEAIAAEWARLVAGAAPDVALKLITRRDLRSMNSWLHNVDRLIRSQHVELDVHPDDAARLGLADRQDCRLRTQWDEVPVTVVLSPDVRPGTVCYPHGWGHAGGWRTANAAPGSNINRLLGHGETIVEAISGTTIMDGIPVELLAG